MYVCGVFFFVHLGFFWTVSLKMEYCGNKRFITGITPASLPLTRLSSFMLASLVYHVLSVRQKCTNYPVTARVPLGLTGTFHLWLTQKWQHSENLGVKIVLKKKKVSFILKREQKRGRRRPSGQSEIVLYTGPNLVSVQVSESACWLQAGQTQADRRLSLSVEEDRDLRSSSSG